MEIDPNLDRTEREDYTPGVADRWLRSHGRTYEQIVLLDEVKLMGPRQATAVCLALTVDSLLWCKLDEVKCFRSGHETEAWQAGLELAGKLGLALFSRSYDCQWNCLADPDTTTVIVPGSRPLFKD